MDIQEKQARWALEKPLFEAEFIHSHLLPFFNFNENTGDYEIKSEFSEDEDQKVAYETLNTGWVMWLRAKRAKAQSVPYEPGSFKSSHEIIINETKSELIDGYDIAKEDEYLLESLVYRGVCIGKAQAVPEGFVLIKADNVNSFYQDDNEPENFCNSCDDLDTLGDLIDRDEIMTVNKHTSAHISTEKFYGAWGVIETSYGMAWKFKLFNTEDEAKSAIAEAQEPANE